MKQRLTVVGAGIAGLTTAAYAARQGLDVTVIEASPDLIGGLCAPVRVAGRHATFGPRYLWNFGDGQPGRIILEELGIDGKVTLLGLDADGFDRIYCDRWNEPIRVPMGWHRYLRTLSERFPQDRPGLKRFFAACEDSFAVSSFIDRRLLFQQPWPKIWLKLARSFSTRPWKVIKFSARAGESLLDAFDRFGLGKDSRIALSAHRLIFAEPIESLSFHAYAGATLNYMQGACFPEGGMDSMIEQLTNLIEGAGGRILTGDAVCGARTGGRDAIDSLVTQSGSEFQSEFFVSTIAPRTLNRIFETSGLPEPSTLPDFGLSGSVNTVFLRLSEKASIRQLTGRHNTWICVDTERAEGGQRGRTRDMIDRIYVNCPSAAYGDGSSCDDRDYLLSVFLPADRTDAHDPRERFDDTDAERRSLIEDAIALIEQSLGVKISNHVIDATLFRPGDVQDLFGAEHGNVYGKSFSTSDVFKKIPIETRYSNLFQAGHFTSFAGVANSMQTAKFISRKLARQASPEH